MNWSIHLSILSLIILITFHCEVRGKSLGDSAIENNKRQKVPGWWGRRDSIEGAGPYYKSHDRNNLGNWWGRRNSLEGAAFYYKNHDRKKPGDWWGRRDEIDDANSANEVMGDERRYEKEFYGEST